MSSKARSGHAIELNSTSNSAKLRKTCDACQAIKTRCSRDRPSCVRCQSQNIPCHYSVSRRIGRPRRLIPPPSPILRSNGRQLEEPIQATQLYSVNWSGVDAEVESPRIMESKGLSNSSSDAVEHQRTQGERSLTPRVGPAPIPSITRSSFPSAPPSAPELSGQDIFSSFIGNTDFSRLSGSSLSSSPMNEMAPSNHTSQSSLDDSEVDRQPNPLYDFGQPIDHNQFPFTSAEKGDAFGGPTNWGFSNEATVITARDSVCQCLESALGITLSLGQCRALHYPGTMDLALGVVAQLREAIPLAVHCIACKSRQGEIFELFSNAMADVVDILEQLCNVEFPVSRESPPPRRSRPSSLLDGSKWIQQTSPGGRSLSGSSHQLVSHGHHTSGSSSLSQRTSNNDIGTHKQRASQELQHPSLPNGTSIRDRHQPNTNANSELSGWRILVGRHQIVGEDRKFILMLFLRRHLCALSKVLEGLIRAMQDLRISLKRIDCFLFYDDDATDTRKPMKTALKLYDIIDYLENIQI